MTRTFGAICAVLALAACQPRIPDSAAGVGFDNGVNTQQARNNVALPPAQAVSTETVPAAPQIRTVPAQPQTTSAPLETTATAAPQPRSEAEDIANEASAALAAASANSGVLPLEASPSNPAPQVYSNPGISDENDFAAVGERRSIEADAALRAQNQANYSVVTPTAVPTRTGEKGPNVVAYALSTTHQRGTKVHSRLGLTTASRHQKACANFSSDQAAQLAFLERGGPRVDRLGLDPDGDGYACAWDPSPFRKAARN